jgi:hypothetical protein
LAASKLQKLRDRLQSRGARLTTPAELKLVEAVTVIDEYLPDG